MQTNSNTERKTLKYFIKKWIDKRKKKRITPKKYVETELTADGFLPAPKHICKEYKERKSK